MVTGIILPNGSLTLIVRAQDVLGGTGMGWATTMVAVPVGGLGADEVRRTVDTLASSNDGHRVLNGVATISTTPARGDAGEKASAKSSQIYALGLASSVVEADPEALRKTGQVVGSVIGGSDMGLNATHLSGAADAVGATLDTALSSEEPGLITQASGTALLGSIGAIAAAAKVPSLAGRRLAGITTEQAMTLSAGVAAVCSQLGDAALKDLDVNGSQVVSAVKNGKGTRLLVAKVDSLSLSVSGLAMQGVVIPPVSVRSRRLATGTQCPSASLQKIEWIQSNPYSWVAPELLNNAYVSANATVITVDVKQCGLALDFAGPVQVQLPIPPQPAVLLGYTPALHCGRLNTTEFAWSTQGLTVLTPINISSGLATCASYQGSGTFALFWTVELQSSAPTTTATQVASASSSTQFLASSTSLTQVAPSSSTLLARVNIGEESPSPTLAIVLSSVAGVVGIAIAGCVLYRWRLSRKTAEVGQEVGPPPHRAWGDDGLDAALVPPRESDTEEEQKSSGQKFRKAVRNVLSTGLFFMRQNRQRAAVGPEVGPSIKPAWESSEAPGDRPDAFGATSPRLREAAGPGAAGEHAQPEVRLDMPSATGEGSPFSPFPQAVPEEPSVLQPRAPWTEEGVTREAFLGRGQSMSNTVTSLHPAPEDPTFMTWANSWVSSTGINVQQAPSVGPRPDGMKPPKAPQATWADAKAKLKPPSKPAPSLVDRGAAVPKPKPKAAGLQARRIHPDTDPDFAAFASSMSSSQLALQAPGTSGRPIPPPPQRRGSSSASGSESDSSLSRVFKAPSEARGQGSRPTSRPPSASATAQDRLRPKAPETAQDPDLPSVDFDSWASRFHVQVAPSEAAPSRPPRPPRPALPSLETFPESPREGTPSASAIAPLGLTPGSPLKRPPGPKPSLPTIPGQMPKSPARGPPPSISVGHAALPAAPALPDTAGARSPGPPSPQRGDSLRKAAQPPRGVPKGPPARVPFSPGAARIRGQSPEGRMQGQARISPAEHRDHTSPEPDHPTPRHSGDTHAS